MVEAPNNTNERKKENISIAQHRSRKNRWIFVTKLNAYPYSEKFNRQNTIIHKMDTFNKILGQCPVQPGIISMGDCLC